MSKHLRRDLEAAEREILAMSSLVEDMIDKACRALRDVRVDLANEVISQEGDVDQREVRIEEECLKILALHQPVAVDLRCTAMMMKINNDLERIADLAVNIAECTHSLAEHPDFEIPARLEQMSILAIRMVREGLDSFVHLDVRAAKAVCNQDDEVNVLNREIVGELYGMIRRRPEMIEPAMQIFAAAHHIERIADLATNIAEDVIYLVNGEIARHRQGDSSVREALEWRDARTI